MIVNDIIYIVKGYCMGKKKSDNGYDLSVLSGKHYSKSNALVNSKGKANLLAQKLFAIGIQQAEEDEKTGILTTTLRGTDLKKIFGTNRGSFYDDIKALVEPIKGKPSLLDWRVVFTDDQSKTVEAINVIMDCKFEDGIFQIRYNDKVNKQIRELKANYTVFSLAETIPLKSLYSFKLYEILKSEYDRQDYLAKKNGEWHANAVYVMDIELTDLKLRFGIIDASISPEITQALKKSNPDYREIERLTEELPPELKKEHVKYKRFDNFRKSTIEVAKKELAEKTSIFFDYDQLKSGRGGKTTGIRFFIHKKVENPEPDVVESEEKELSEDEKYEIIFEMKDILGKDFSAKDVIAIAQTAKYDVEKVKFAYELMLSNPGQISNPTGWLIDAIQKGYEKPKQRNAKPRTNSFNNFEQTTIDFVELENQLLDN